MTHREQATAKLHAIPEPKRKIKWRKTVLGGLWMAVGLVLLGVAIKISLAQQSPNIVFFALGLGAFAAGSHMISSEYTSAGAGWAIGAIKDVLKRD